MISCLKKIVKNLINKKNLYNWTLATFELDLNDIFGSKKINKNIFKKINLLKHKKTEFAADPFFFKHKKKTYVFYEKFYRKENKGVISVAEFKDNNLYNDKDILVKKYHLSYPNIFKYNKNIYLIPETYQARNISIYKFIDFPHKLKKINTFLNKQVVADPTFFKYRNSIWFFVNKTNKNLENLNKDLFLYRINKNFTKVTPHKQNPIKRNTFGGRSAGSIIKYKNKYIRPAQINKKGIYGYGLVFFQIKKLNIDIYQEKKITSILPKYFKNTKGVHHFSYLDGKALVDLNLTK
tara:strand:+ start:3304 stop:4185 length:882 start_codon:yes stop_codon:yes gene_type:complete